MSYLIYFIPLLLALVAIILAMGLYNMLKGGSANRSQTLMRYRVLAQFAAVIAIIAAVFFFGKS